MRSSAIALICALSFGFLAPAHAIDPEFVELADYQAGFDPSSNFTRGGPGSRMDSNSDASVILYSDFRYFNNYGYAFPTENGNPYGAKLYLSTDDGATFAALSAAPEADWGPVEISEDGQVIAVAPWRAYIDGTSVVSDSSIWLSVDGGQSFTKQPSGDLNTANWDLAMDGAGELIIATQDSVLVPKFIDLAADNPTWATLPGLSSAPWRNASINLDATVIAVCNQDSGIFISRDRAASFTQEIANESGEGCGPMELSGDGNTLVIGRFASPNKKVFKFNGSSWDLVKSIAGLSAWFSTGSVSVSGDGSVITIGDYLNNLLHISFDAGATFESIEATQDFLHTGMAYVSPDGKKIFSFNMDALYLMDLDPPAPEPVVAAPYEGPVIKSPQLDAILGKSVVLQGENLESIFKVLVGEKEADFSTSSEALTVSIPKELSPGPKDLVLHSDFGVLTIRSALMLRAPEPLAEIRVVETPQGPKLYHMTPVGIGKIQVLVDGVEVFWVSEEQAAAGIKLRQLSDGSFYLVRSLKLSAGSKVTVLVDGVEVFSETYQP